MLRMPGEARFTAVALREVMQPLGVAAITAKAAAELAAQQDPPMAEAADTLQRLMVVLLRRADAVREAAEASEAVARAEARGQPDPTPLVRLGQGRDN